MMLERLADLEAEHERVEASLADPDVLADQARYTAAARRYHELGSIVALIREHRRVSGDLAAARELASEATGEDRTALRGEIDEGERRLEALDEQLRVALLPPDPNDAKNVIVEIRGAEGGEEANLFARDLLEMYKVFAARRGWRFELLGSQPSALGGFQEVSFLLAGDDVWSQMKFEGGPHRVQRVPVTESQGRVHTSSATVSVLAEADEVDVELDPNDLQVDVFRASGPGGQSVNTTDSAVRITHVPTGTVVSMQDEKSQLKNKTKAMRVLRARLAKAEQDRRNAESSASRRDQIGGGGRSEKVRTYNVKDNRVTDHRIGLTLHKLDRILSGELDEVIDALVADDRAQRLAGTDARGAA